MTLLLDYWKPIPGFESLYEISCTGQVRRKSDQKYRKQELNSKGYWRLPLRQNGVRTNRETHTIVADAFIGLRPKGSNVNHKDSCKTNNRASNLEIVSAGENQIHYWQSSGSTHRRTSHEVMRDILTSYPAETPTSIAKRLGISFHTVYDICRGKRGVAYRMLLEQGDGS